MNSDPVPFFWHVSTMASSDQRLHGSLEELDAELKLYGFAKVSVYYTSNDSVYYDDGREPRPAWVMMWLEETNGRRSSCSQVLPTTWEIVGR